MVNKSELLIVDLVGFFFCVSRAPGSMPGFAHMQQDSVKTLPALPHKVTLNTKTLFVDMKTNREIVSTRSSSLLGESVDLPHEKQ